MRLLCLLHWQAGSLPSDNLGSPGLFIMKGQVSWSDQGEDKEAWQQVSGRCKGMISPAQR